MLSTFQKEVPKHGLLLKLEDWEIEIVKENDTINEAKKTYGELMWYDIDNNENFTASCDIKVDFCCMKKDKGYWCVYVMKENSTPDDTAPKTIILGSLGFWCYICTHRLLIIL